MYQFLETIKLDKGKFYNLKFHQKRMDETFYKHYKTFNQVEIKKILKLPNGYNGKLMKVRLMYNQLGYQIEFHLYKSKNLRSVKLVMANHIDYSYKTIDRTVLSKLKEQNMGYDEVLIVKNKMVTDTSYSNIVFFDGHCWHTPNTFLLNGTQRQLLLSKKLIKSTSISINDLNKFSSFKLINALNEMETTTQYSIDIIKI
jgi:4-amino-4-deoxychorismate lyase